MIQEYETHNTLNPKLWNGDKLHDKLKDGFVKIAEAFYDFLDIKVDILDVLIIGSSANYNWTEHSDIDLHVLINYLEVGDNLHLVKNYMHAKKSIWNVNYPLKYKGMHIELYAQDSNEELHSSVGIYSLLHNKWIHQPSADKVSIDDTAIKSKAEPYEYEIDSLLEEDPNAEQKIQNIKQRLRHLRQTGLDAIGEYSIENMAFKYLRNQGYLERLNRLEQQISRGRLSIEHVVNELKTGNHDEVIESLRLHVTNKKMLDENGWDSVISNTNAVIDPMGQWNHPGRCTMIPTRNGEITMRDVPHKVLGIDDTGHMLMMHPEHDYRFPGRNVFEIPHTAQYQTMIMQLQNLMNQGSIDAK
jgi:predicted nucleotidyltransferase